jgi:uncharacterized protein (TIGR02147 family)
VRKPSPSKEAIRAAVASTVISEFTDYRVYLQTIYAKAKSNLPSYSYIKFAVDLGFGSTNMLRLIIIGDRSITAKTAQKLANALDLHGDERKYFVKLIEFDHEKDATARDQLIDSVLKYRNRIAPEALDETQLKYFSEWYNPVVREMVGMDDFQPDPDWIRQRLNFPLHLSEIKKSLEVLEEIGFINKDSKTGKYKRSKARIHTPFEVDSLAIVRFHQKMIEMGKESITRISEKEREINALTANIPAEALPLLREKITQLMDEMENLESETKGGRVYQLNIQLFPFTKS